MTSLAPSIITGISEKIPTYQAIAANDQPLTWCGGCGNFSIQKALHMALTLRGYDVSNTVVAYDVGCSGNESDKNGLYTIHGLHGRVLPLATGIALANRRLKVVAHAGDGATFSEGVNHLVHALRNNVPVVFILHQNGNFGLTTGQASAASKIGQIQTACPDGVEVPPINIFDFILSLRPAFFARTWSGDVFHMTTMISEALQVDGFAIVEVLQACPTYNRVTTHEWLAEHVKDVETLLPTHDPYDHTSCQYLASLTDVIPIGVLARDDRASLAKMLPSRRNITTETVDEVQIYEIDTVLQKHF